MRNVKGGGRQAGRQADGQAGVLGWLKQAWVVAAIAQAMQIRHAALSCIEPQPNASPLSLTLCEATTTFSHNKRACATSFSPHCSPVHVARVCTLRHCQIHWQLELSLRATLALFSFLFFFCGLPKAVRNSPEASASCCFLYLYFSTFFLCFFSLLFSRSAYPLLLTYCTSNAVSDA